MLDWLADNLALIMFVVMQVIGLAICIYFPSIILWLPRVAGFLD